MKPKYSLTFFLFLVKVLNVVLFYRKFLFLQSCFLTLGSFRLLGIAFIFNGECSFITLVVVVFTPIFYFNIGTVLFYKHVRQELILAFHLLLMVGFGLLIAFQLQIMKPLQVFIQVVALLSFCFMF